jgi:hypothetical protein
MYIETLELEINSGDAMYDMKGPIESTLKVSRIEEIIIRNCILISLVFNELFIRL